MLYNCKSCGSHQNWIQCEKCGKVVCKTCASLGKGSYPKLKASNKCPYCNKVSTFGLKKLTGREEVLKPFSK